MTLEERSDSCPRLCPSSVRQRPIDRPDFGRGRSARRCSRTARQDHAALGRAAASGRGRGRQIDLAQWRPILPAWIWIAWLPPCGRSRSWPRVGSRRPRRWRRSARSRRRRRRRHGCSRCAAAAGAVALAVIFGVQHLAAAALIFVSAAAGAILRRGLARYSANIFLQPFCAALLAGVIGALAVRYQLSSSLRLVAVCPCMVLVPGPHVLNGALDLIKGRIHLGAARLIYAGLVIVAISTGLLLGLALFGVSLPVDQAGRARAVVARHDRRRRRRRRLQHLLLHAAAYAGLAGRGRHAGPCAAVGGAYRARLRRRRRAPWSPVSSSG